jgi:hypothetical protein
MSKLAELNLADVVVVFLGYLAVEPVLMVAFPVVSFLFWLPEKRDLVSALKHPRVCLSNDTLTTPSLRVAGVAEVR